MTNHSVNGLSVPPLLLQLLAEGRWRHPGEAALRQVIPWIEEPLELLTTFEQLEQNSDWSGWIDDSGTSEVFYVVRGSAFAVPVELPWLDGELFVCIAVSRENGDDCAIMLDYRTSRTDPRVVASDWNTADRGSHWREVAPAFSAFVAMLGL